MDNSYLSTSLCSQLSSLSTEQTLNLFLIKILSHLAPDCMDIPFIFGNLSGNIAPIASCHHTTSLESRLKRLLDKLRRRHNLPLFRNRAAKCVNFRHFYTRISALSLNHAISPKIIMTCNITKAGNPAIIAALNT